MRSSPPRRNYIPKGVGKEKTRKRDNRDMENVRMRGYEKVENGVGGWVGGWVGGVEGGGGRGLTRLLKLLLLAASQYPLPREVGMPTPLHDVDT